MDCTCCARVSLAAAHGEPRGACGETYANSGTALRRYVDNATDLARKKYHVTAVPYNNRIPSGSWGVSIRG